MDVLAKREQIVIEATRLIGRNSKYIRNVLRDEMINSWETTMMIKPLRAMRDDKGKVIATTRMMHYANTALIAYKISKNIFPDDEELCLGISTAALLHDLGQCPFGHDGELALKFASAQNNGSARLHNIEGAMKILFRYSDKIKYAINTGRIMEKEAKKRNITQDELKKRIDSGLEYELSLQIANEIEKNKDLAEDAIKILAMAAGNHNGERGTSTIIPNLDRTFEEFYETAIKTYIDPSEDKNMQSCNIVDAITKISDQISSITFDIIDAKRAGIEDEIFEGWAEPISKVLKISEEEAKKKLKGNNKELLELAMDLQEVFINDVGEHSNKDEIKMTLSSLLYGETDKRRQVVENGLRTFNMEQHTAFTSGAEAEVILNNSVVELTDVLSRLILDENGTFPPQLNEIFRISKNMPIRKTKERILMKNYKGDVLLEQFYKYITELSPEEYKMNKEVVKKQEVNYFRKLIEKALEKESLANNRSLRGTTAYLIETYMLSPSYEAMTPDEDNKYSDDEVRSMIDRINAFLNANPIAMDMQNRRIKHLSLLAQREKYQIGPEGETERISIGKVKMNTDQQIAARLAISYINTLNDKNLIDLLYALNIIDDYEKKIFELPYIEYSDKRKGNNGHVSASMAKAMEDYSEGTRHAHECNNKGDSLIKE